MLNRIVTWLLPALLVTPCGATDGPLPKCEPEVKMQVADFENYYPSPCERTLFSVVVKVTVDLNGKPSDPEVGDLSSVPETKRQCLEELLKSYVLRAARFSLPSTPCRYEMRISWKK